MRFLTSTYASSSSASSLRRRMTLMMTPTRAAAAAAFPHQQQVPPRANISTTTTTTTSMLRPSSSSTLLSSPSLLSFPLPSSMIAQPHQHQGCALFHSIATSVTTAQHTYHHQQHRQQSQRRSIFIQTAETPNPESLKFVPTGYPVLALQDDDDGDDNTNNTNGFYVTTTDPAAEINKSPHLVKPLLAKEGIKAVYLGVDFITVTKFATAKWKLLRPFIFDTIMTWADSGQPALLERAEITDTTILDDDDEVVAMIKELMESRIRPAVQEDGGDIRYVGFDEVTGQVTVQLAGSCVGCPSSSVTLKQGVENMLMHYIPEVTTVIALDEEEEGGEGDEGEEAGSTPPKQKSYEDKLAQAGIPFSD